MEEGGVVEEEEAADLAALRFSSEASRDECVTRWARTRWSSDLEGHPMMRTRMATRRRRDGVLGG